MVNFRRSRYVAHLNELRRRHALPPGAEQDAPSALEEVLASAGNAHELKIVEQFRKLISPLTSQTPLIESIPMFTPDRYARTEEAIRARTPMIQQAALTNGFFGGYADLLVLDSLNPLLPPDARRAAHPAGYSLFEIKLASTNRLDYSMQAAVYANMLSDVLERLGAPKCRHAYLCLGGSVNNVKTLDVNALGFLLKRVTDDYMEFLVEFDTHADVPDIDAPMAALRPWVAFAQEGLDTADSLLNIANIRRSQANFIASELRSPTLSAFADLPPSKIAEVLSPSSPTEKALRQIHLQATLQAETSKRTDSSIAYRVLRPEEAYSTFGLNRIAPRHDADVYFDIEGYPLFADGGLEYLFGCTDEADSKFYSWWAHSRPEEETAFIRLIDWLWNRSKNLPEGERMHIYHYGNYEIASLRRVSARSVSVAGREAGRYLERLIAAGSFVDIYKVVKSGLVVGGRSYSIKTVEKLVGVSREGDDLADAESSVALYHRWRVDNEADEDDEDELAAAMGRLGVTDHEEGSGLLKDILLYNRQDCDSLREVVGWLRKEADANGIRYEPLPRADEEDADSSDDGTAAAVDPEMPPEACGRTEEDKSADARTIRTADALSALFLGSPSPQTAYPPLQEILLKTNQSKETLQTMGHLLQFHAKESAPVRFRFMDRVTKAHCLQLDELVDDHEVLAPVFVSGTTPSEKGTMYEFEFNAEQVSSVKEGSSVATVICNPQRNAPAAGEGEDGQGIIAGFMRVTGVDKESGRICLKTAKDTSIPENAPVALVRSDELILCPAYVRASLVRTAEGMIASPDGCSRLVANFLARQPVADTGSPTELSKETLPEVLRTLGHKTLVIQGPPGSGKTTYSAKLIRGLLDDGKTVAISSNSHAAIDNLLQRVVAGGFCPERVCKIGPRTDSLGDIRFATNLSKVDVGLPAEELSLVTSMPSPVAKGARTSPRRKRPPVSLVGSTVYGLARASDAAMFDYLFVDEASQVPMANFVSMAPCATAAVLVGDHQQLQMPLVGSHADCVQRSCLSHLAGEGVSIVSPERGLFLGRSYRMQSDICRFVSDSFYDGALGSHPTCAGNEVKLPEGGDGNVLRKGKGIVFIPSDGSTEAASSRHSPSEAAIVARVIQELLGAEAVVNGAVRRLTEEDVLVVSSFNSQVQNLCGVLPPDVRVGTVDKFQGQEAPVVIVSTCAVPVDFEVAASAEGEGRIGAAGSSRNLQFTTNPNRLNVAISRASCLAVVVGHSKATHRAPISSLEAARSYALYDLLTEFQHG